VARSGSEGTNEEGDERMLSYIIIALHWVSLVSCIAATYFSYKIYRIILAKQLMCLMAVLCYALIIRILRILDFYEVTNLSETGTFDIMQATFLPILAISIYCIFRAANRVKDISKLIEKRKKENK
jgi:membrane-associated HD superfamily phosphohydrolase